jgi:hypothetical protein
MGPPGASQATNKSYYCCAEGEHAGAMFLKGIRDADQKTVYVREDSSEHDGRARISAGDG